nr:GerAB/ArcD/ProY family transporter [Bacilli bacterium]
MHKINLLEYVSTFFMIIMAPFLGMGLYNLLIKASIDSSISVIIGYILSFAFLIIFIRINDYKSNLDLKDKINVLFKRSKLIIILFSIALFSMSLCLSYNINNFIISQFLSETPIIYTMIILGMLIIFINSKDITSIFRVSNFLFYINIILIMIAIFGEYNKIELINMLPILTNGINRPIIGSVYILIFQIIYMFILLIIPKDNVSNNKHMNIGLIIAMTLAFILFLIIIIYTIGSLGIDLAMKYHYPAYIVMKEVSIFGFIDKIENFIIIHWVFEMFILLSLITYFINKLTNIKNYILVILNIILCVIIFRNSTLYNTITKVLIPISSTIILIIIIMIYLKIKKTG